MYAPVFPGFAQWLQRRGVPVGASVRAEYLNRNVTAADTVGFQLSLREGQTFGQQAAEALRLSFDWKDTREGEAYWSELHWKLKQTT